MLEQEPTTRTLQPICTGASVIAVMFDGGVAVAADRLASYGKMARFRKVPRLHKVNACTLLGITGDYADYQLLQTVIETKLSEMTCRDPDALLSPKALYSWLTAVMYNRRSRMNPLWNTLIVAGVQPYDKKPFLGSVNLKGVAYGNEYIATGMACMLCQQTLENEYRAKEEQNKMLTKAEAMQLLEKCIEIMLYRDCTAHNEYEIGVVTADGVEISEPKVITGRWDIARYVCGYE